MLTKKALVLFLVIGFFYRLVLASFAPWGLIYDTNTYHQFALDFMSGKLVADCCDKNVGYSALMSVIYSLFGVGNVWAVRGVNILMDLASAIMVFVIAQRIFKKPEVAWTSFLLYLFNPYTAAYTGVRLAESATIFYTALLAFFVSHPKLQKNPILWMILGIVLGLLLFTRLMFKYFVFLFIGLMSMVLFRGFKRVMFGAVVLLFFLVFMLYPIIGNYKSYGVVSLTPPYNIFTGIIYLNFWEYRYPELLSEFPFSPIYGRVFFEFHDLVTKLHEVPAFQEKYKALLFQRLPNDWPIFTKNLVKNMIWMWDKRFLYPYVDPFYPGDTWWLRFVNIGYIGLFFYGIIKFLKSTGTAALGNPVVLTTLSLFFYMTILFPLGTNETRHTLVFYPFLSLWAGFGVFQILRRVKSLNFRRNHTTR